MKDFSHSLSPEPLPLRLQSTPRVGGGSAFYVRQQRVAGDFPVGFRGGVFWWFGFGLEAAGELVATGSSPESFGLS